MQGEPKVFIVGSPLCGTCSAARNPLPDGSAGPPLLRTPGGLPDLSPRDALKARKANELYTLMADFLRWAHLRQIPWLLENHTHSIMWMIPVFHRLIDVGHFSDCESCAYGGFRPKKASFLGSSPAHQLTSRCPGHKPWGQAEDGPFNTALEAEYPQGLCHAILEHVRVCLQPCNLRPTVCLELFADPPHLTSVL